MKSIVLAEFKGMSWRGALWSQGYSRYAIGTDIFGLNDNPNKFSYPGVIQGSIRTPQMAQAASPSAVTEDIQDFAYFETSASTGHFAIGRANPGRIYRLDNVGGIQTWKYVSAINVSGNGNNLLAYNGDLYYATNTNLGKYDFATGNANFQAFTDTFTSPRPMKVYSGSLFIGAGRYVAKYDGSTFSATKLTLPSNYCVRSMEVYKDRLCISADDGSQARLFIWDGVSSSYEEDTIIGDESYGVSLVVSNGVLWAASNKGNSVTTTQIYVYDGTTLQPQTLIPAQRTNLFDPPCGVAAYSNGILVAGSDTGSANYEDGTAGLWYVGRDTEGQFHAVDLFLMDGTTTLSLLGGVFTGGKIGPTSLSVPLFFYANFASGSRYILGQDTTNYYTNRWRWISLPIDANDANLNKVWNFLKVNVDPDVSTTNDFKVWYRLDYDTTWIALGTYTSVANSSIRVPIRRKSRVIEIRIEGTNSLGNTTGGRFRSFELFYSPTGQ